MTEQKSVLPEERIAKLEARLDSLQQRLLSTQELACQNRSLLQRSLAELLTLLRWAYSHCKSHGHVLRLNDFQGSGNQVKAILADLDDNEWRSPPSQIAPCKPLPKLNNDLRHPPTRGVQQQGSGQMPLLPCRWQNRLEPLRAKVWCL